MTRSPNRLAVLALLCCGATALPALAASSASSAASDSVATSVGSISDSLKKSSNSSSKTDVADGDYTVIDVALAAERPGQVRLTLRAAAAGSRDDRGAAAQPATAVATAAPASSADGVGAAPSTTDAAAGGDDFYLYLPQPLAERLRLASGQTIAARQRPYGVEFAAGAPRRAFFLALADDWYRELLARPLAL